MSFIFYTCWVPTISVLNLAIFPCYSNLLLRRRRWAGILQRGVLGYGLPQLPFMWCYGVFCCSVSLRVVLVFKDIIYVIIILYNRDIWLSVSTFGRICGTINHGSCIQWVLGLAQKPGMTFTDWEEVFGIVVPPADGPLVCRLVWAKSTAQVEEERLTLASPCLCNTHFLQIIKFCRTSSALGCIFKINSIRWNQH
jgi:hypothetical protein